MKPIAIFYHCLFFRGSPEHPAARGSEVINRNMLALSESGLLEASSRFIVGINGGKESEVYCKLCLPDKAQKVYHGLQSRSENSTILLLESFSRTNPGWNILYFHSKGACHTDQDYIQFVDRWVNCMTKHCITNWRQCVEDLESFESVGCHWMTNMSPPSDKDNIWGGNFWWCTSEYAARVPSLMDRPLIKEFGVNSEQGAMESERWIGCSGIVPTIKDYHVNGIGMCP